MASVITWEKTQDILGVIKRWPSGLAMNQCTNSTHVRQHKTLALQKPFKTVQTVLNSFKQILPTQKSFENGRYRSEDSNIERHEN